MRCDEFRERFADRLDDLLEAGDARAVDEHLAACPACADHGGEVEALRALLYEKERIDPPSPELVERILLSARRRTAGSRLLALARYAAVFLAGAGAAFVLRPEVPIVDVPAEPAVSEIVPHAELPAVEPEAPRIPRRIR